MLTTILTVLGIVSPVALLLYWIGQRKQRRAITYDYTAVRILGAAPDLPFVGNLSMTFNGNPIDNASIVNIVIRNSGGAPIRSNEFEKPLTFAFAENSEILAAEISSQYPNILSVDHSLISYEPSGPKTIIVINPLLLNAGDSITISALVSRYMEPFVAFGRVVGVKEIERVKESTVRKGSRRRNVLESMVGSLAAIGVGLGTSALYLRHQSISAHWWVGVAGIFSIMAVIFNEQWRRI